MKKLVLRWFLVFLVTVIGAVLVVNHVAFMSVMRQMERDPTRSFNIIITMIEEGLDGKTLAESGAIMKRISARMGTEIKLLDPGDRQITHVVKADIARRGASMDTDYAGMRFGMTLFVPVKVEGEERILRMGPFTRPFSPDLSAYVYMGIFVLLILIISTLTMSMPMFNRLRKLEKTARTIADGDLSARVPIPADDGLVGFVAQQFNTMAMRIEQLMASQKMMLQAVSHELRTPTARIRFGLEMLESSDNPEERARRLEAIDEDLTEVDEMVEELMLFNKMEALGRMIEVSPTPVMPALRKLVDKRGFIRPGVEVRLDGPGDEVCVNSDPRAFLRATGNLLSNALRFSKSRVVIVVREDIDSIKVSVCDDGPGVPESEREAIFFPFKRLDDSRNRESGGAGLGLAIVNSIVSAHGGRIEVTDSPIGGACFSTWWPQPR